MTASGQSGRGRHDPWKAAFFGVAAVALVGGVAWALLGSSLFVVRTVRLSGTRPIPAAKVLAAAGIKLGTPLIRVNTAAVARRVEQVTQVQSARVTKSWPDTIVIWATPRRAVLAVPAHPGYDLMDPYGVVLGWSASRPAGLVVLKNPAAAAVKLRGNAAVLAAGTVVQGLPSWLRAQVTAVRTSGPSDVTLILRGGRIAEWGSAGRAAAKVAEMALLLRTHARYYDVSDPQTAVTSSSIPGNGMAGRGRPGRGRPRNGSAPGHKSRAGHNASG
jgi:cell division protein FtsQ